MNLNNNINLLQKTPEINEEPNPYEKKFQTIGISISSVIIILAILTGVIFLVLRSQEKSLAATKQRLVEELNSQSEKEVIYHALVERITTVKTILDGQKKWEKRFDLVSELANPPILKNFSGGSDSELTVNFHVNTFDEARSLANTLFEIFTGNNISSPRIVSYAASSEEGINLSLGFQANF